MEKKFIFECTALLLILLLIPAVYAQTGGMTLLAVSETADGYEGSIADLYLDIRPGSGNVFVDTFPITKMDTQISMRFAKQIACNYLNADCSKYDFIYTIQASSGIVGGPSAGAAATVLTVALLENLKLNSGVVITGTINSGGIIGPVGGMSAKIKAAEDNGFTKVLVPIGELNYSVNSTINKINIATVSNLDDAVYEFTGKRFQKNDKHLEVNPKYEEVMEDIAVSLCKRSDELEKLYLNTLPSGNIDEDLLNKEESAFEAKQEGNSLLKDAKYYPAASMCFSSNIKLKEIVHTLNNISNEKRIEIAGSIMESLEALEKDLHEKELATMIDLQTYMIVDDRIQDAKEAIGMAEINSTRAVYWLAYAEERQFSIKNWLKFFDNQGTGFELDSKSLKQACITKLSEAEERLQYVRYYFPYLLEDTKNTISSAEKDRDSGKHVLCIFKASKAKAESSLILGLIGVEKEQMDNILNQKIIIAEQAIAGQQENGIFPIMAYSYYEYAKSLREKNNTSSALVYSEYAIELSNFDIYFEKEKSRLSLPQLNWKYFASFAVGIIIGMAAMWAIIKSHQAILLKKIESIDQKNSQKKNKRSRKRR